MTADNVRVQPGSSHGVRALKGYLHYAATGILDSALFTGREPDSDFEVEVAAALRDRGLEVVAQVGVAGYFIDLAVKDPDRIDAFILGIECDGRTYHSSLSARDRDRLRQAVLEGLGWNIHRIWSTDWFRQREREIERILAVVERARERNRRARETEGDASLPDWEVDTRGGADTEWAGEAEYQPLTDDQLRSELAILRDQVRASDPSIDADDSIFRDEMLAQLVKLKPRTRDDWLRAVPLEVRICTNGEHVSSLLASILAITAKGSRA
jgi:very-short-patch-repair endonuclease